jgi:hypothetical protein
MTRRDKDTPQIWRSTGHGGGDYAYLDDMTDSELAKREEMQKPYLAALAATKAHQEAVNRRVAEQEKQDQANKVKVFL